MRVKIKYKDDNKLAEFSYKILHNILICGKALNKWTKTPSTCEICEPKEVHDIPHMIYYCTVCNDIWNIINIELQINIELKHIILLYKDQDEYLSKKINYCIQVISFNIYKYWIVAQNSNNKATKQGLISLLITDLNHRTTLMKAMNRTPDLISLLEKISKKLKNA